MIVTFGPMTILDAPECERALAPSSVALLGMIISSASAPFTVRSVMIVPLHIKKSSGLSLPGAGVVGIDADVVAVVPDEFDVVADVAPEVSVGDVSVEGAVVSLPMVSVAIVTVVSAIVPLVADGAVVSVVAVAEIKG